MAAAASPRFSDGLTALAEAYDHFLLDQWGVLHDGFAPYEGVVEALASLKAAGKKLSVITNSGRTGEDNAAQLARLGIGSDLLDAVVSSGDLALDWLLREAPQRRCFAICSRGDPSPLEAAGVPLVERVEEAELIFLSGMPSEEVRVDFSAFEPWIEAGIERGLTLICANPDRHGPHGKAVLISSGTVAAAYEARGGSVISFGKPGPEIYRLAMAGFPGIPPARCVMVGDMPETDLAGAAASGIDAVWVLGGVHARDVGAASSDAERESIALDILARAGAQAAWVLPSFRL